MKVNDVDVQIQTATREKVLKALNVNEVDSTKNNLINSVNTASKLKSLKNS